MTTPKRPLGLLDFGYVADVLRAGLANEPSTRDACTYRRALDWVEQVGAASLSTEQEGGARE
ncbi:hypothetical protein [Hymenobacter cheonanensis]|uniref:hypothetical protein n=1 Tax=Hymenobacter sp. CA2-7 TaxID=3063993 RepID=UPI002712CE5C|nr:hypothetical protein [Hymenobacter sp. CA2-7]MDO7886005.1 hypothetical protein [Hymenobacter sp. CA2-7]